MNIAILPELIQCPSVILQKLPVSTQPQTDSTTFITPKTLNLASSLKMELLFKISSSSSPSTNLLCMIEVFIYSQFCNVRIIHLTYRYEVPLKDNRKPKIIWFIFLEMDTITWKLIKPYMEFLLN